MSIRNLYLQHGYIGLVTAEAVDGHFQPYNRVLEPINFIFVVKGFKDAKKANKFLVNELNKAGFTKEYSDQHTIGYAGIFKNKDGRLEFYKQIGV